MPQNTPDGNDFITALNAAAKTPGQSGDGKDLPDGFPMAKVRGYRTIDSSKEMGIDGATAVDYASHRKVFLVYRPWDKCNRCANALANGKLDLPDDEGDLTCPHTQVNDYKEIVDKGLAGQLVLGSEQETVMRDGTIVVSLKYYEQKINYKKLRAQKKQLERDVATQTSEDVEE